MQHFPDMQHLPDMQHGKCYLADLFHYSNLIATLILCKIPCSEIQRRA